MVRKIPKWAVLTLALLTVFAPAADAVVTLSPVCAPMMQAAQHACCPTACECSLDARLPVTSPSISAAVESGRTFVQADPLEVSVTVVKPEAVADPCSEEVPPPKAPLYEAYSDYRL